MGRISFVFMLLLVTPCWAQHSNKIKTPSAEQTTPSESPMGSVAYLDSRYGFRGHEFNMGRAAMGFTGGNCINFMEVPSICHYPMEKEDRSFGAAEATSIDYVFDDETFMGVDLWFDKISSEGRERSKHVLPVLLKAYGKGQPDGVGRFIWKGKKVTALYDENESPRTPLLQKGYGPYVRVSIWSNELAASYKQQKERRGKAKKQRETEATEKAAKGL